MDELQAGVELCLAALAQSPVLILLGRTVLHNPALRGNRKFVKFASLGSLKRGHLHRIFLTTCVKPCATTPMWRLLLPRPSCLAQKPLSTAVWVFFALCASKISSIGCVSPLDPARAVSTWIFLMPAPELLCRPGRVRSNWQSTGAPRAIWKNRGEEISIGSRCATGTAPRKTPHTDQP